jgi:exopolysaccharide production protein ExoY
MKRRSCESVSCSTIRGNEQNFGRSDLPLRANTIGALNARGKSASPLGGFSKRAMDIIIGSLATFIFCPSMIVISILIRLIMGGPILCSQFCIGLNGVVFKRYSFRTCDAGGRLSGERSELLGHALCNSSLDKLPQLFNVIRGDMSFVGPEAIVASELMNDGHIVQEYFRARPGLTGVWRLNPNQHLKYQEQVALDCGYARSWSLWNDLFILVKTIAADANRI